MKTNSLTSHTGESSNSRADKMSGSSRNLRRLYGYGLEKVKKFYNRKRRMFLKNPENWEKI